MSIFERSYKAWQCTACGTDVCNIIKKSGRRPDKCVMGKAIPNFVRLDGEEEQEQIECGLALIEEKEKEEKE